MIARVLNHNERSVIVFEQSNLGPLSMVQVVAVATGCGGSIFLGPMPFSNRLRLRYIKLHRVMGRVYVAALWV